MHLFIGFYILGVQCGVEEALRATRSVSSVERPTARLPVNVRNERTITMGNNRQLVINARRPSSGFSSDVREIDLQNRMAGGSSDVITQQIAIDSVASKHPNPDTGKLLFEVNRSRSGCLCYNAVIQLMFIFI